MAEELKPTAPKTTKTVKEEVAEAPKAETVAEAPKKATTSEVRTELDKMLGAQAETVKLHNKMIKMYNVDVTLTIGKGSPTERKISLVDFAGQIKKQAG